MYASLKGLGKIVRQSPKRDCGAERVGKKCTPNPCLRSVTNLLPDTMVENAIDTMVGVVLQSRSPLRQKCFGRKVLPLCPCDTVVRGTSLAFP